MTQKDLETKIAKKYNDIEKDKIGLENLQNIKAKYTKLRNTIPDIIMKNSLKEKVDSNSLFDYHYLMTDNNVNESAKDICELVLDELIDIFGLKEDK